MTKSDNKFSARSFPVDFIMCPGSIKNFGVCTWKEILFSAYLTLQCISSANSRTFRMFTQYTIAECAFKCSSRMFNCT